MKKTTIAVLTTALLLGGAVNGSVLHATTNAQPAQNAPVSGTGFSLNPGIEKQYGGAAFTLESLKAGSNATEFSLSRIVPENIDKEIDKNIMAMNILVIDTNGRIYERIQAKEQWRQKQDGSFDRVYTEQVAALKGNPKTLKLKPYVGGNYDDNSLQSAQKANVTVPLKGKYPIVLDQGKIGTVAITSVEYGKDKTVLNVTAKGEAASVQTVPIWLVQNGKSLNQLRKELIGVDKGVYRYQLVFPAVDKKAALSAMTKRMTPVTFLKELEMEVNLDQK